MIQRIRWSSKTSCLAEILVMIMVRWCLQSTMADHPIFSLGCRLVLSQKKKKRSAFSRQVPPSVFSCGVIIWAKFQSNYTTKIWKNTEARIWGICMVCVGGEGAESEYISLFLYAFNNDTWQIHHALRLRIIPQCICLFHQSSTHREHAKVCNLTSINFKLQVL